MRIIISGEDFCLLSVTRVNRDMAAVFAGSNTGVLSEELDEIVGVLYAAKVVVYLNPEEFKSTWLGNKSVYRTRMAIADGGELIVLAPGIDKFGEDGEVDRLIRKYGYCGRENVIRLCDEQEDLKENLSAAAHLIHGSSDGRFTITYCTEKVTQEEVEGVCYRYLPYAEAAKRYDPVVLTDGWHTAEDGERFFYISNPALGLWADKRKI